MIPQIVPENRNQDIREEGMLFVRTEGITHTLIKAPLLMAGLIAILVVVPLQNSFGSTRSLDLILYPDGSAHVSLQLQVDSLQPDFRVDLYGTTIDNFVAVGENGFLLTSEIQGNSTIVETFGSSEITIDYDIHDLISKEGRIWTFSIDAPIDFTLLMPPNSVIVGLSTVPSNMEIIDDKSKLYLQSGPTQIDYIFGTPTNTTPPPPTNSEFDYSYILLGAGAVAALVVGASILKRTKGRKTNSQTTQTKIEDAEPLEPTKIFNLKPDLREDDKEIVSFIYNNGGQAYESDLRKKFLQPRTTMWRAVKRLERQGIITIEKKDLQNLIKLTKNLEEDQ